MLAIHWVPSNVIDSLRDCFGKKMLPEIIIITCAIKCIEVESLVNGAIIVIKRWIIARIKYNVFAINVGVIAVVELL
ncbi:hypothetical protein ES708_10038 [subsurface metagenome]